MHGISSKFKELEDKLMNDNREIKALVTNTHNNQYKNNYDNKSYNY